MKNKLVIGLIVLMIYSCRPSGYDIRTLDKRELTFKELPTTP